MCMKYWFVFLFTLLFSFPAYAVATPSDLDNLEEVLEDTESLSDMEIQDILFDYLNSLLSGPSLATPSEESEEILEDDTDFPVTTMSAPVLNIDPLIDSIDAPDVNVVWYSCQINGNLYQVAFPKQYANSLWVSDSGYLYNVSGSDVTGRVFDSDPASDDTFTLLILSSLFNNGSMNDLHEYNSLAELREYYWDSYDRSRYNSSWVHVQVNAVSETLDTSQYPLYILIFLVGGVLICLWRRSLR